MIRDPHKSPVLELTEHLRGGGAHDRLIQDVGYYAELAGIQPHWIWQPLSPYVGEMELEWVTKFRRQHAGLLFIGESDPEGGSGAAKRMEAIVGCLVRNFLDARMRTLDEALEASEETQLCTLLAIPDLCASGEVQAGYRAAAVWGLLTRRATAGRKTVAYVRRLDFVAAALGQVVADHLHANFVEVRL